MRRIDFAVIGGQKCGSTYIQSVLDAHPDMYMPADELPHLGDPDYAKDGLARLEKILDQAPQAKLLGIKRPNYLNQPEVPARLKAIAAKNLKLIMVLRNPVERFVSAYYHYLNYSLIPLLPINDAVPVLLNKDVKLPQHLLTMGCYAHDLGSWLEHFDLRQMQIHLYDDLRQDRDKLIAATYAFLGVNSQYVPKTVIDERPQKVNYHPAVLRLQRMMNHYRFDYDRPNYRLERRERSKWDQFMLNNLDRAQRWLVQPLTKPVDKPKLTRGNITALQEYYAADITALSKLLNRDLNHWLV